MPLSHPNVSARRKIFRQHPLTVPSLDEADHRGNTAGVPLANPSNRRSHPSLSNPTKFSGTAVASLIRSAPATTDRPLLPRSADCAPDAFRGGWHFDVADAERGERVDQRIGDRR